MMPLFNFEVHTPIKRFFDSRVQAVVITLVDGEIGVYANHSPFVAITVAGILKIKDFEDNWKKAFVSGGILEVKGHKNVLVADIAEWPEDVDKEAALAAIQQAKEIVNGSQFKFEIEKAKEDLRRAELRLKLLES